MNVLLTLEYTHMALDKERAGDGYKDVLRVDMSMSATHLAENLAPLFKSPESFAALTSNLWDGDGALIVSEAASIKIDTEIKGGTATLKTEFDTELTCDKANVAKIVLVPKPGRTFDVSLRLQLCDLEPEQVGKLAGWLRYDITVCVVPKDPVAAANDSDAHKQTNLPLAA